MFCAKLLPPLLGAVIGVMTNKIRLRLAPFDKAMLILAHKPTIIINGIPVLIDLPANKFFQTKTPSFVTSTSLVRHRCPIVCFTIHIRFPEQARCQR
jgi:hypothetical protein